MAKDITEKIKELMAKPENIRNMGIMAHVDHGKTTLSDSLLAGAGMLSEKVAGEARALDFLDEEQERGITIQASNITMIHTINGKDFLINLIDTPGHVDFGGEVTRAMRAVDGALVLIDSVEGAMPQTETVVRQALRERVKPILFVNKVDRLLQELKLKPEEVQERFLALVKKANSLINNYAPKEYKKEWQFDINTKVAFGSAIDRWAISLPFMKEKGISFKDIIDAYSAENKDKIEELAKKAPLHKVLLNMIIDNFPNPKVAQSYRVPKIWHGDKESKEGKALITCDSDGPLIVEITKVTVDDYGEISTGRIFSGKIKSGQTYKLIKAGVSERIQNVVIYKGNQRVILDEAIAGNIIGITGLKLASSGETLSDTIVDPFEGISHIFEPVVTKAIEATNPKELPKLIQVLRDIEKEDPSIKVLINEETGEHLICGLGELHLEWIEQKITKYKGLNVKTSQPIVVYRESVKDKSGEAEGKSPNKHNRFYMTVEPLDKGVYDAITDGEISEMRVRPKDKEIWKTFHEYGMSKEEARSVQGVKGNNVLIDLTKGIVQIREVMPMILDVFEEISLSGPLAREPVTGVKMKLVDIKLHEDAIHRGPAQVHPAVRESVKNAFLNASPVIYEPIRVIRIDAPQNYMSNITKIVQSRRGSLLNIENEGQVVIMECSMPVNESFGFTTELRSATSGRGVESMKEIYFDLLPKSMQADVIKKIRDRKGLTANQI